MRRPKSKRKSKFPPELVKEYGEQVYRDHLYNKNSLEDNSYCNMEVAWACGLVEDMDRERFRKLILEYAEKTV